MAGNGIIDLLSRKLTLEERIIEGLNNVPTDADLEESYADADDRTRVIDRSRVSALLTAVFEHNSNETLENGVETKTHIFNRLARIQRSFSYDTKRLNNGQKAKLMLAPVGRESIIPKQLIEANRERRLRWLVLIELWNPAKDKKFSTQKALLKEAANQLGTTEAVIKTELSRIRSGVSEYHQNPDLDQHTTRGRFSTIEIKFYIDLEKYCRKLSKNIESPFSLLLPALYTLKSSSI